MTLKASNIGLLDVLFDIEQPANTNTGGMRSMTWAALYSDVNAKEIKSRGSEKKEFDKPVGFVNRAFAIRKFDRSVTNLMRVNISGELYYITATYPYAATRDMLAIECEYRDDR
jgi:head-tail adaptor